MRPSARFPTLEMRICDVCTYLEDAVCIAALFALLWFGAGPRYFWVVIGLVVLVLSLLLAFTVMLYLSVFANLL